MSDGWVGNDTLNPGNDTLKLGRKRVSSCKIYSKTDDWSREGKDIIFYSIASGIAWLAFLHVGLPATWPTDQHSAIRGLHIFCLTIVVSPVLHLSISLGSSRLAWLCKDVVSIMTFIYVVNMKNICSISPCAFLPFWLSLQTKFNNR